MMLTAVALLIPACDEPIDADGNAFDVVHSADELRSGGEPEIVEMDGYRVQIDGEAPEPDEGEVLDPEMDFTDLDDEDVSYYELPPCKVSMNCETRTCIGNGNSFCIKLECDHLWGNQCGWGLFK